jgi:hypothetical protein
MSKIINNIVVLCILTGACYSGLSQTNYIPECINCLTREELQEDFQQFRRILENEHCCLYEYSSKEEMDSLFDIHYRLIEHKMKYEEFFGLIAPITAKIGCLHTATWMPGRFFSSKSDMMFPLKIKLIDQYAIVTGSYLDTNEIPVGSIIIEINGKPVEFIIEQLRKITSADALNPYFIDAQLTKRFSMFYASVFGLPDSYEVLYALPGRKTCEVKKLTPASIESVRKVVFSHFNSPPLTFKIVEENNAAIMTVSTFIYYDKVDYFRNFMDSCFSLIKEKKILNLILDLRGNDGGDPFCSSILLSYIQKSPVPYFAEPYGKYSVLADPVPLPQNHFNGNLYTLIDGSCGSTNGHFCALLKYHNIGKFIGTPGGSTYKCNAGKNTEFRLPNSKIIVTIGRSTYSAAVDNMDKTSPIMPDFIVNENYKDFLNNKDLFIEKAIEQINLDNI